MLTASREPLTVKSIIEQAVPLTGLGGKTPGQTVYSILYSEAKKGTFVQVAKGRFKMGKVTPAKAPAKPAASKPPVKAKAAAKPRARKAPAAA